MTSNLYPVKCNNPAHGRKIGHEAGFICPPLSISSGVRPGFRKSVERVLPCESHSGYDLVSIESQVCTVYGLDAVLEDVYKLSASGVTGSFGITHDYSKGGDGEAVLVSADELPDMEAPLLYAHFTYGIVSFSQHGLTGANPEGCEFLSMKDFIDVRETERRMSETFSETGKGKQCVKLQRESGVPLGYLVDSGGDTYGWTQDYDAAPDVSVVTV